MALRIRNLRTSLQQSAFSTRVIYTLRDMKHVQFGSRQNTISETTRRDILDELSLRRYEWAGRLPEAEFSARVWDLSAIRSRDPRHRTVAGDIHQHRDSWCDWDDDWIFHDTRFNLVGCEDDRFLRFLTTMVSPVVRSPGDDPSEIVEMLNGFLAVDGWELYVSGSHGSRSKFEARRIGSGAAVLLEVDEEELSRIDDPGALNDHLERIGSSIETDPAGAIGSAKELIETVCKTILDDFGEQYKESDETLDLVKSVIRVLELRKTAVSGHADASASVAQLIRSQVASVQAVLELRNKIGRGHGRTQVSPARRSDARFVCGVVSATCRYLLDAWHERKAEQAA